MQLMRGAKALGAYYTPETIADVLAEWLVDTGGELLLEPSAGDGALIRAARARAVALTGSAAPLRLIACDVDPRATESLRQWLSADVVRTVDFLSLSPDDVAPVDGILTNPPFTRNHALPAEMRADLRERFKVEGAAGLWVHFLLHACKFLVGGGRLAAVVPASAVFTHYGRRALERICQQFAAVELRRIIDRPLWASRTDERGAILLARGFNLGSSEVPSASIWSCNGGGRPQLSRKAPTCFTEAIVASSPLGTIASLSIGAVTGGNHTFLMSEKEREQDGIPLEQVLAIVSRSRHVSGLSVTRDELGILARAGERTWLLAPRSIDCKPSGARRRLARISRAQRRETAWLLKRNPWWAVNAGPDCDAIFTYMNDKGPRLVLAGQGLKCTNTLHRVLFREGVDRNRQLAAALTVVSTFGQLAAEQIGRSYGGGMLKFELAEARLIPVLDSTARVIPKLFGAADQAFRAGRRDEARHLADQSLMPAIFGRSWRKAVDEMNSELNRLRSERRAGRPR